MFSVILQYNESPKNQLIKTVTDIIGVNGTLKNGTSIINPSIIIECNLSDVVNANYMYIQSFNRYYFINNITSASSTLVQFDCHVDVLMTYANEIMTNNSAIIKRQEKDWNLYLNDGSFNIYQDCIVQTKAFPSGFTTQTFVLAVAGS